MEPRLASDCSFGCFNAQLSGLPSPGLVFLLPVVVLERVLLPQELTEDLSKLTAAAFRMKMRFLKKCIYNYMWMQSEIKAQRSFFLPI